ncbi:unknown [Tomato leaf curl betasatellite-JP8]|uniref:Uncharacterized protein n=1 Tax=Tomato leaf curl betasatellite-JP8 TaxID=935288 RepID=E7CZY4_9VIRU|nr:unknown [Tomato leaf curl betasatellite-JP8]
MSSCLNSWIVDSLYIRSIMLRIPSSSALKLNGGMIPLWPYGIMNCFVASTGDPVEKTLISTRIEVSSFKRTLMMNSIPFLFLYLIVIVHMCFIFDPIQPLNR